MVANLRTAGLLIATIIGCTEVGFAQNQAVQLPSVGQSSAATSISVPDGGRTLIGGSSRGLTTMPSRSTFPFSRGPVTRNPLFGGPAYGRSLSGGSMTASVRIIDLHEMDRQILALSPAESSEAVEPDSPKPAFTANDYLRKADEAEAKGKPKVAEIYRRLAAKHATKETDR